jgi:uracil phosphoribosyltransferase
MITKNSYEHLITILRNEKTSRDTFRETAHQIGQILAVQVSQLLPKINCSVKTPIAQAIGQKISGNIILLPILRSGIALLAPFLSYFTQASVGFIGMKRDEYTAKPHLYYYNLPKITEQDNLIILDPMLATGGTADATLALLKEKNINPKTKIFAGVICAPEGLTLVQKNHPDVTFVITAHDQALTKNYFITPGLGDFGDRYFGTE